ncbi:RNAse III [Marinitoga hydrogenitolerans DSM 16785]|uniref:Ribonuclease 3 n=1 Tax=Marinitoga hydrogenitolerans (strain DSM 16785 / JCM 12826 / AT1271) TaxID=1122195 RepID=A0A1M4UZZ8_MARH1|nr:ribonuclease III [Marinitoga hydrogenitolerans]SHE62207.1 RNAse III [Marinitoga hydrogenitolerans DSM 16785]
MNDHEKEVVKEVKKIIGIDNIDEGLLFEALCHSSYSNDYTSKGRKINSNERLEFLGDSVLNLIIAEHLFKNFDLNEGDMARIRATVGSELILFDAAKRLNLGDYILLSKNEEKFGGREKHSIISDLFEAIIGAIYLSLGFEKARSFALKNLKTYIKESIEGKLFLDYKTRLQELTQKDLKIRPEYKLVRQDGPPHNRTFVIEAVINGKVYGKGIGKSKKVAEQLAAKEACENFLEELNGK